MREAIKSSGNPAYDCQEKVIANGLSSEILISIDYEQSVEN